MEIKRLDWDSNLFGYEVGKMSIDSDGVDSVDFLSAENTFKLIYVESNIPLDKKEFGPCYTKITYCREVEKTKLKHRVIENFTAMPYSGHLTDQLLNLTYQSGVYSRFKLDVNFTNNEYKKLYKKWIENSLNGKVADSVIVVKDENSIILGFVTIKFKNNISEIGLIAVDDNARGLGVGSLLLNKVSEMSKNRASEKIFVSTQKDNKLACGFYEKNGFKKYKTKYIHHWWVDL